MSTNAITMVSGDILDDQTDVSPDQLELIKRTVAQGASNDELKLYLYDCKRRNIHPLDKFLHFTKRGGKYTPITSIDYMRSRASETGDYAGSDDAVFQGTPKTDDFTSTTTVHKIVRGILCSFTATARWSEYKPDKDDFMWKKMPHTMLSKCSEALALRKGFPQQLHGLYAREEMAQAGVEDAEIIDQPPASVHRFPQQPVAQIEAPSPASTIAETTIEAIRSLAGRKGIDVDAQLKKQGMPTLGFLTIAEAEKLTQWLDGKDDVQQATEPPAHLQRTPTQQKIRLFWGELKLSTQRGVQDFFGHLETKGIEFNGEVSSEMDIPEGLGKGYANALADRLAVKDDPLI